MNFQGFEKKKKVSSKPKKIVNYTTIRKQAPSFEHSAESMGSIIKYPKNSKEHSLTSKSNSKLKYSGITSNTSKNITCKSISINQGKSLNNSKIIRLNRYMKKGMKKMKNSKKDDINKCEIDLNKTQGSKTSSRRRRAGSKKDAKGGLEESKTVSGTLRSPSLKVTGRESERGYPMHPEKALKMFGGKGLMEYEKKEILDYKNIYFIGNTEKKVEATKDEESNYGYDDSRGDYNVVENDHIFYRYEILSTLGQGSFGKVYKAFDHKEKKQIALKIIRNKKKFEFQANIEIKVLLDIKKHDEKDKSNIIKIINNFKFRNHICLSFDLYSINLYELIRSNDHKGFPLDIVRRIAIQILQGLRFMRKRDICH